MTSEYTLLQTYQTMNRAKEPPQLQSADYPRSQHKSWGYLLLTPLALAMALSPTVPWESNDSEETGGWSNDEGSDEEEKDVPDPIESGFDIPVL